MRTFVVLACFLSFAGRASAADENGNCFVYHPRVKVYPVRSSGYGKTGHRGFFQDWIEHTAYSDAASKAGAAVAQNERRCWDEGGVPHQEVVTVYDNPTTTHNWGSYEGIFKVVCVFPPAKVTFKHSEPFRSGKDTEVEVTLSALKFISEDHESTDLSDVTATVSAVDGQAEGKHGYKLSVIPNLYKW